MKSIIQFIKSLGALHDATVTEMRWLPQEKRFEIGIEDLYQNFKGLPDYPGPTKGRFVFSQVSKLYSTDVDFADVGLMIYELTFRNSEAPGHGCEIRFSPGGKMLIECQSIECCHK